MALQRGLRPKDAQCLVRLRDNCLKYPPSFKAANDDPGWPRSLPAACCNQGWNQESDAYFRFQKLTAALTEGWDLGSGRARACHRPASSALREGWDLDWERAGASPESSASAPGTSGRKPGPRSASRRPSTWRKG